MAIAPWGVLAAGKIRSDAEEQRRRETGEKGAYRTPLCVLYLHNKCIFYSSGRVTFNPQWERNENERKIVAALEKVASEVGAKHVSSGKLSLLFLFSVIYGLMFVPFQSLLPTSCKRLHMFSPSLAVVKSSICTRTSKR